MPILSINYGLCALLYFAFSLVLATVWRKRNLAPILLIATSATSLWALSISLLTIDLNFSLLSEPLEVVKNSAWIYFLFRLLLPLREKQHSEMAQQQQLLWIAIGSVFIASAIGIPLYKVYNIALGKELYIIGYLCWSLIGLIWIEWLFRQTKQEQRWAVKFLCLGCAVIFGYDFYMYSHALLYKQINYEIWQTRGLISTLAIPLIAIAISRNPPWTSNLFLSKRSAVHSMTIMGAAIYLLMVAAAGYYVKTFGGRWGPTFLALVVVAALVLVLLTYFSGDVRSRIKVYFQKNFSSYKYDYRDEWLQFVDTLANPQQEGSWKERSIRAIAEVIDSQGGLIWLKETSGTFEAQGHWHIKRKDIPLAGSRIEASHPLPSFLSEKAWVIEKPELLAQPAHYASLELPESIQQFPDWWLIVPLLNHNQLIGFILLFEPKILKSINWEDHDLLKTCARHLAHYVALSQTTAALVDARQFEAFNQMSAFLVHDLKNVVAQLGLIVSNAQYHKTNPAFVDDAIDTVANAVQKMERILTQLRRQQPTKHTLTNIDVTQLFNELKNHFSMSAVQLEFDTNDQASISSNKESLLTVLTHLIQNAIDVSNKGDTVTIKSYKKAHKYCFDVIDYGCGMDETFIRERLFKPFDSTKGKAGMGIGVYQSRELINQLGGELLVNSKVNEGTTFTICLPDTANYANTKL